MWFCSVSWPTNSPVNLSFFGVGQIRIVWSQRPDNSFLSSLMIFWSSLDIREWQIFKKDWTKNSREWTKENFPDSETGQFFWTIFFGWPQKMRNWLDNWLAKETDQNHMDVPSFFGGLAIASLVWSPLWTQNCVTSVTHLGFVGLSSEFSARQAQREMVKIRNLNFFYCAWSTPWRHVLSLNIFSQNPVLSWAIRYSVFQPVKFGNIFKSVCGNLFPFFWHLMVKFGYIRWF
jgi:hypothetical protein